MYDEVFGSAVQRRKRASGLDGQNKGQRDSCPFVYSVMDSCIRKRVCLFTG